MEQAVKLRPNGTRRDPRPQSGGAQRARAAAPAIAAFAAAALAGGCSASSDNGGVASLDREAAEHAATGSQADTARAMADCLVAAGIPATAEAAEDFDGALVVQPEAGPDDFWEMSITGESTVSSGGADGREDPDGVYREQSRAAKQLADEQHIDPVTGVYERHLLVGRAGEIADFTDEFVTCLDTTGYTDPTAAPPEELLTARQQIAAAGAEWAECARGEGWPMIADPAPPTLGTVRDIPVVLLPGTITPDQLRALIAVCPNWDRAAHEAEDQLMAGPDFDPESHEPVTDPALGFDAPGYDGQDVPEYQADPVLEALNEILNEQAWEYASNQEAADGASTGPPR
jgi:hypothetical protein